MASKKRDCKEASDGESAPKRTVSEVSNDDKIADDIGTLLELKAGQRLEVKWNLTAEATGEVTPKWWGCELKAVVGTHTLEDDEEEGGDEDPEVCQKYEIEYDAFPPDYPDKAVHEVCFLSDRSIYDVGEDGLQAWRRQGDPWDEDEDEDEEGGGDDEGGRHGMCGGGSGEGRGDGDTAAASGGGGSGGGESGGGDSYGPVMAVSDVGVLVERVMASLIEKHTAVLSALPYLQQGYIASVVAQSRAALTGKIDAFYAQKAAAGQPKTMNRAEMEALLAAMGAELAAIKATAAQELTAAPSAN